MQSLWVRSVEIANMLGLFLATLVMYNSIRKTWLKVLAIISITIFGFLLITFLVLLGRDLHFNGFCYLSGLC